MGHSGWRFLMVTIVVAGVLASSPARAGEICPPAAVVDGAPGIVRSVRALLRAHGVAAEPGACAGSAVHARLLAGPAAHDYQLHIVDGAGRTSERRVRDAETAASLIESWAIPEADALVDPRPVTRAPVSVRGQVTAARPAPQVSAWQLAAAGEVAEATDGSFWYGGTITGCARLGALCVGARLRYARDDGLSGPSAGGGDLSRDALGALALVALPIRMGALTLIPTLGAGADRIHTEALAPGVENDPARSDAVLLRVEAAAVAALALGPHLSLVGEVNAAGGRSVSSSRASGDRDAALLVGPPAGVVRLGIGCQFSP